MIEVITSKDEKDDPDMAYSGANPIEEPPSGNAQIIEPLYVGNNSVDNICQCDEQYKTPSISNSGCVMEEG